MDKIREDNDKLKEQVKLAFGKVKVEMGKVQGSIDKDQDVKIEKLEGFVHALQEQIVVQNKVVEA